MRGSLRVLRFVNESKLEKIFSSMKMGDKEISRLLYNTVDTTLTVREARVGTERGLSCDRTSYGASRRDQLIPSRELLVELVDQDLRAYLQGEKNGVR